MADEHPQIGSDDSDAEECETPELRGVLSKWTNYIHGWQDRFIVLRDGTLSYYKSELESNFGCRGALSLLKANVKPHEFDECRFDVSVNDCVWYLRATTPEEKQQWLDVLEYFKGESGYGTGSDSGAAAGTGPAGSTLRRHDSAASLQSCGSSGRGGRRVADKIAELDTYAELLTRQADLLQHYFDICETQQPDTMNIAEDTADPIDAVKMLEASPAAVAASEVRASAGAFRVTCAATKSLLQQCGELLRRRECSLATRTHKASKRAKDAEEMCSALSEQLQEARIASYPGPDFEEGPHSTLPEDEFYDAVETGLDKIEEERCSRLAPAAVSAPTTRDHLDLPSPRIDSALVKHPLFSEIERVTTEQLQQAFEGVGGQAGWQLFAEEGDMRMYRREVEIDGMVVDPLKAMHIVRGVTGRELCHYFFNPRYRHDWEATLETMTIVEPISNDTLMFHQSFKRVWPASQRDAVFWSHVRAAPDNKWTVVNHSMHHPDYPANTSKCIRVSLTVCLACQTEVTPSASGAAPRREDVTTSIAYCSTVNPGGWAPASVLRAVYKREYPKFLKRFTHYVADQCQGKPLAL